MILIIEMVVFQQNEHGGSVIMKRMSWISCILAAFLGFTAVNSLYAAAFEQAFKLTKINGECNVMTPDAKVFAAAAEGKAYPYGSKIATGRKSSVIVEFSSGNICRVLASSVLVITEDAKDAKAKSIKLEEGRITVELEEKFHENNSLNVETAAAICGAIGCKFTVSSTTENDLKVVVVTCDDGKLRIFGPDFEIPLMEKDDAISISKAIEKDFVRIKNIKGSFNTNLKNSQGEPVTFDLKLGYSIKIYREVSPSGNNMLVYVLILTPEGKTEATYAYSRPLDTPAAARPLTVAKSATDVMDDGLGITPITTTTTTTTSTTTTTIPPGDLATLLGRTPSTDRTTTTTTMAIPTTTRPKEKPTPTPVGYR